MLGLGTAKILRSLEYSSILSVCALAVIVLLVFVKTVKNNYSPAWLVIAVKKKLKERKQINTQSDITRMDGVVFNNC